MNTKYQKSLLLIVLGLLIVSMGQVVMHFELFPDMVNGGFIGVGIGLLIMALIVRKPKLTN